MTLDLPDSPGQASAATSPWLASRAAPANPACEPLPACRTSGDEVVPATVPPCGEEVPRPTDVCPVIPGYKIERELGHGGMGVVYLAVRQADGLRVALKTIIPEVHVSPAQVQRFIREANILQQLKHKHIVEFLGANHNESTLYLAMSYVEGADAARLVRDQGPLPVPMAVRMIYQLLSALAYAHDKGFVHRDIKPGNLLVTQIEAKKSVKLADFGLARVYQESRMSGLTIEGDQGGTPAFMAPEQVTSFRKTPPSADQYSAAATLYNLLTAKLPFDFEAGKGSWLTIILQNEPVPILERRADLPRALAAIIHRAMAKDTQPIASPTWSRPESGPQTVCRSGPRPVSPHRFILRAGKDDTSPTRRRGNLFSRHLFSRLRFGLVSDRPASSILFGGLASGPGSGQSADRDEHRGSSPRGPRATGRSRNSFLVIGLIEVFEPALAGTFVRVDGSIQNAAAYS